MQVYDGHDQNGNLVYFEIGNLLLSRAEACKVVARVPGVEIVRRHRFMSLRAEDTFVFSVWAERPSSSGSRLATIAGFTLGQRLRSRLLQSSKR